MILFDLISFHFYSYLFSPHTDECVRVRVSRPNYRIVVELFQFAIETQRIHERKKNDIHTQFNLYEYFIEGQNKGKDYSHW